VKDRLFGLDIKMVSLIVSSLVILVIIFGPVGKKTRSSLAIKKSLTNKLEVLETKLRLLEGVDQVLIDVRVERMEAVFPSKKPVIELISSLSQLASSHGLSFGGVSLSPGVLEETEAAELGDLGFGFEVEGSFEKVSSFMHDLENVAPLMKIDDVSLKIKTNPLFISDQNVVSAGMQVSAFFQAPPKTLGAVTQPVGLLSREEESLLNKLVGFKTFAPVLPTAETGKTDLFSLFPVGSPVGPPEE